MSSFYVRNLVRQWATDTPGLLLPFFDTINFEQRPKGPAWATVAFVTALTQTSTYCGTLEERGTFDYIALGAVGVGDADLLQKAEHDVALLMAQVDPLFRLTLLRAGPAEDYLQAGGVPWYSVSLAIEYVYMQPASALA